MYTTSSNRDQVGVGDIKDLPGEVTSEHNKTFTFLYLGYVQLRFNFRVKTQKLQSRQNIPRFNLAVYPAFPDIDHFERFSAVNVRPKFMFGLRFRLFRIHEILRCVLFELVGKQRYRDEENGIDTVDFQPFKLKPLFVNSD